MRIFSIFVAVLLVSPVITADDSDALDDALSLAGMSREDLGWKVKGWWPRFPDVPYKLRSFDSLFELPLDTVTYTRALAATAATHLDPATLDDKSPNRDGHLFQAVQRLGIDPKFGGFRGYSANLTAEETPLHRAMLKLVEQAGRPTKFVTFGTESPYPTLAKDFGEMTVDLPAGVSPILGQLVLNVTDACAWAELAFRKVDAADRMVVSKRFNLGEEVVDALDYCPQVDDVARTFDEASLWYAAQKCVQAMEDARVALQKLDLAAGQDCRFDWESPWGWIRIRGTGDDDVNGDNSLLIVDLGGNDRYRGGVGASNAGQPISLLLDLSGDDQYRSEGPSQGAGLTGVGIVIDAAGNDAYEGRHYAQGAGQFGLGLLADLAGDDRYFNKHSGQGCGFFGIGLLFDVSGNDVYTLYSEGQGFGGANGVGLLADRSGDDRYTAVREHSVTGRPSYHSPDLNVGVSNAQGCAMGRRGDGADGHSWAGGLGALLDAQGNDIYKAGNWSMGTGYWFGMGLLHDGEGDDEYRGVAWTQGTGAHFCIGVMVDESGNDKHLAEVNSRFGMGFGHDFTIGILVEAGGDDHYSVSVNGYGGSINRSVAMLLETGGDDTYETSEIPRPGYAENNEQFRARPGVGIYFADTTSIGLHLDVGGEDTYWGDFKNNSVLLDPEDSPNWLDRNFGVFVDRESGIVDLTPIPVKKPSASVGNSQ